MYTQYQATPGRTPRPIKLLIASICLATLGAGLLEAFFVRLLHLPGPQTFLTLSPLAITHFLIWQPVTYLFVHGGPNQGLSFGLLIELAFHAYLLWAMGSTVLEQVGTKPFLRMYFLSGILAGILTLITMMLTGSYAFIGGCTPALLATLFVWTMLLPDAILLLFFILPIKAKWLMAGIVGAILLVNLSHGDFVSLVNYLAGIGCGYFYGLLAWELRGPFECTHTFDRRMIHYGISWRYRFQQVTSSKIFDIRTGKAQRSRADDDAFVDAMLDKIAKHGQRSLSWRERWRLAKISKRKSKHSRNKL